MYLCAKDVTRVEGWRNCSTWNNLGACGFVEKSWKKILDGVWSRVSPKAECSTWNTWQGEAGVGLK